MRLPASGWLAAGALGAAALLFTGASLPELAQEGRAPRSDPTQDGRPPTQERPQAKDSDAGNDGADAATSAASAPDPGIRIPENDVLRIVPHDAAVHAVRGTDSLRVRGWFWVDRPKADTSALVTLHPLDLADTAQSGRRIRSGRMRVRFGLLPKPMGRIETVHVPGRGIPVWWTAAVPVTGVRSGTYRGYLLATRETETLRAARSPVAIPVVVRIKDAPWPALAILLLGLPLVLLLRWYRDRRQQSDSAYGRIAAAEALIVEDPLLAEPGGAADPFRRRFAEHLRAAAAALDPGVPPGKLEDANARVTQAEELWVAWQEGRPDWQAGLQAEWNEIQALEAGVGTHPPSPHASALLVALRAGHKSAPDLAVAEAGGDAGGNGADAGGGAARRTSVAARYREGAETRARRARRYLELEAELASARIEAARLEGEAREALLAVVDAAGREWNAVADPSDDAATDAMRTRLADAVRTARANPGPGGETRAAMESAGDPDEPGPRELIPRRFRPRIRAARDRRRLYAWTVSLIIYLVLVFFGFKETWGASPVFGADWLADYLSVVAWALGLNAVTLATVGAFTGRLTLPWSSAPAGGQPNATEEDVGSPESARAPRRASPRPPALRRL
ncbi:MAG TPA: hypothetical protein VFR81_20795 [Longimicrobium sp.]|nr:hypothetical protein [Longimicrobium sp.]